MKPLKCIIMSLSLLFVLIISGCAVPKPIDIRYFNSYVECPCPDMPQFSKIQNLNHIGSVEEQEQILQRLNVIVGYSNDQNACIQCFKKQVKTPKENK